MQPTTFSPTDLRNLSAAIDDLYQQAEESGRSVIAYFLLCARIKAEQQIREAESGPSHPMAEGGRS